MRIMNLTMHPITFAIETADGERCVTVEPSGIVARVSVKRVIVGQITVDVPGEEPLTIPIFDSVFGDIESLPEPTDDTIFVVSSLVAQRCPERDDVFMPDQSVRDEHGRVVACRALAQA